MQEVTQEKEFIQEEDKDFLGNYEIRNWNFSPRIYKILAVSAIVNVAAIMVFAQTNLLTQKGCDSPFVSTVCQVIGAVYVGSTLFGADSDYVVREYNRTEIGEDEGYEVTMIDVSNKISYPAGYFAVANPEQYRLDENGLVVPNTFDFENMTPPNSINPTIPNNPPNLMNMPQNLPPQNRNPTVGKLPDSPFSVGDNPTTARNNRKGGKNPTIPDESPDALPKLDGDETANNDVEKPKVDERSATNSDAVKQIEINQKPLQDFADRVLVNWSAESKNKVDLTQSFKVVMDGVLTKDGKLDSKKSKWLPVKEEEAGNPEIVNVARDAVQAVGDSGLLGYLRNFGAEKVKITLIQDGEKITALFESEQTSPERARSMASGFGVFLSAAPSIVKGDDEKLLLKGVRPPTSNGKFFIINVEIPKQIAQEMINRRLKEAEAKKKEQKNSTAQTINSNSNTGK